MVDVSVILPVHNAETWLDACLQSLYHQDFAGTMELSAYNDSSTDGSMLVLQRWIPKLQHRDIRVVIGGQRGGTEDLAPGSTHAMGLSGTKCNGAASSRTAVTEVQVTPAAVQQLTHNQCSEIGAGGAAVDKSVSDDVAWQAPRGVGFAKNRAVEQSCGAYLCFLDADDVMHRERVRRQYEAALGRPNTLLGCQFHRLPEGSTERYTKWANSLTQEQLHTQMFTSHGPTVIMPTWFCSRQVYNQAGPFDEQGKGTPEDLLFFYQHIRLGGTVYRVDQCLLMYRYHPQATTFSVMEDTIWRARVSFLQERVLPRWSSFTIWNAGKQGRHLYRSLTEENKKKVAMFCDVDESKITKGVYTYEDSKDTPKPTVPIKHFREAQPPFIICVKQDLTGGSFENNLASMNLTEGKDYFHFN